MQNGVGIRNVVQRRAGIKWRLVEKRIIARPPPPPPPPPPRTVDSSCPLSSRSILQQSRSDLNDNKRFNWSIALMLDSIVYFGVFTSGSAIAFDRHVTSRLYTTCACVRARAYRFLLGVNHARGENCGEVPRLGSLETISALHLRAREDYWKEIIRPVDFSSRSKSADSRIRRSR